MLEAASAQSQRNYQISALVFIGMIIVAAIYISSALWWTRKMNFQPLAIIVPILTALLRVIWRVDCGLVVNEITAIFAGLKTMQQACVGR
ncbi:hypothetical protein ACLK17_11550 [Escherichia coli]